MGSQRTRKTRAEANTPSVWAMHWESTSRDRLTTAQQLAAVAAATALLVLVFAGAAGEQPLPEAPAGHVPPAAHQPGMAVPAGAAVEPAGAPTDLVSCLEQSQAGTAVTAQREHANETPCPLGGSTPRGISR